MRGLMRWLLWFAGGGGNVVAPRVQPTALCGPPDRRAAAGPLARQGEAGVLDRTAIWG